MTRRILAVRSDSAGDVLLTGPAVRALAATAPVTLLCGPTGEAGAVCVGNTGPMHLAAAVGTPVVAPFAATVPIDRWSPWMVPHLLLGRHDVPCAGCHLRVCDRPGQPCLQLDPADVVAAVRSVLAGGIGSMGRCA